MICPKCNSKMPDGSKFCGVCGENLTKAPQQPPKTTQPQAKSPSFAERLADAIPAAPPAPKAETKKPSIQKASELFSGGKKAAEKFSAALPKKPVPAASAAPEKKTEEPEKKVAAPEEPVKKPDTGAAAQQTGEAKQPEKEAPVAALVPTKPEKPPRKPVDKKILIATATVVGIVAVVVLLFALIGSAPASKGDNAYVCLTDGRFELILNPEKGKIAEISSAKSSDSGADMVTFSPDGKYLYYFTKYDSGNNTGTLCRAEYGKLKEDSTKNDKYIDIIATNVSTDLRFLEDGSFFYTNESGNLYYFRDEEITQIARDVEFVYVTGTDFLIYETMGQNGTQILWGAEMKDLENPEILMEGFSKLCSAENLDSIYCTKEENDGTQTLYHVGAGRNPEVMQENVELLTYNGNRIYFTVENGEILKAADYVEDSYAQQDAAVKQPDYNDYSIPQYSYRMVTGYNLRESNYEDLYTSCTKGLYWFGARTVNSYSMERGLSLELTDSEEANENIRNAIQNFVSKYKSKENEDGFIPVTEDVKLALQQIHNAYSSYSDERDIEWRWLWLCYEKYLSGNTVDYVAYDAAYALWEEAQNREMIREALQKGQMNVPLKTLYCLEDGKIKEISSNILSHQVYDGGILYNTADMITGKVNLEDIYSTWDVTDLFELDYEAENYMVVTRTGEVCRLSGTAAQSLAEASANRYDVLYIGKDCVYLQDKEHVLSRAEIKNGVIQPFSIITDDALVFLSNGDKLYYGSEVSETGDGTYGKLYVYEGGNNTRLTDTVMLDNVHIYQDGVVCAYCGTSGNRSYELCMTDKDGKTRIVSDDVNTFARTEDGSVLYLSDGDLFRYDGEDRELIRSGVDRFWVRQQMPVQYARYRN